MLYGNYCYIFIQNFPEKFSPCRIQQVSSKIRKICISVFMSGFLNVTSENTMTFKEVFAPSYFMDIFKIHKTKL